MSSSSKAPVTLKPIAGFCIKSAALQPGFLKGSASNTFPSDPVASGAPILLSNPPDVPIPFPKGIKVFVNIAWDANVPTPPEGSEDAIQKAMLGEDADELNPNGWYVPVVVSEARQDTDKG